MVEGEGRAGWDNDNDDWVSLLSFGCADITSAEEVMAVRLCMRSEPSWQRFSIIPMIGVHMTLSTHIR